MANFRSEPLRADQGETQAPGQFGQALCFGGREVENHSYWLWSRSFFIPMAVEEVIGLVTHKRFVADVRRAATAHFGRRHPSDGIQSLYEGGLRQSVATIRSHLDSSILHIQQEPINRAVRGRGRTDHLAPDGACVPGVLPSGAYDAALERVGTEEVGGKLISLVEQRGLQRKQCKFDAKLSALA